MRRSSQNEVVVGDGGLGQKVLYRREAFCIQPVDRRVGGRNLFTAAVDAIQVLDPNVLVVFRGQAKATRLDPQVDVLADQNHSSWRLLCCNAERNAEDAMVVDVATEEQSRLGL